MHTLTVSMLNDQVKHTLEATFLQVAVEGEVSRPTYHNSGHIYFTLKDADSSIKAVMFKGNASKLKFRLDEGMQVVLFGAISVYKPRGEYQLLASSIQASGAGNLALAFEQTKKRLESMGYFDPSRKKPKPTIVGKIVLITSGTSAALQDMLRVVSKRWPMATLTLIDVLVQGEKAPIEIAQAIAHANTLDADAIVIARGGGSIEDLWAFNDEHIARALFESKTFTVSAVGHEIDWTIGDFVADMRAPTPSAAMEMLLWDEWEMRQYLDALHSQMAQVMGQKIAHHQHTLHNLTQQLGEFRFDKRLLYLNGQLQTLQGQFEFYARNALKERVQSVVTLQERIEQRMAQKLAHATQELAQLRNHYAQNDPALRDKAGFAKLSQGSHVVALESLAIGDSVTLSTSKRALEATITAEKSL
ncbi:MAG: hypothetical protein KU28_00230 [Sulfurovum sp. PC08-66]|nr:MAG: hypothetical protein KU28_00230 [Sulfurovum sp. PC08-66]KIM12397.1 MAG: hypothetical protein KU37_00350 [Sulfuricurvum sp. PC08-66]